MERIKRKLEGDVRLTHENIMDIETDKAHAEEEFKKGEFEFSQMTAKLEDEQNNSTGLQKKIKELQGS